MAIADQDAVAVAITLLKATALPDDRVFLELAEPKYTTIDYYRMACHTLFECQRCGNCCTTGDPIRLRSEDAARIARHFKIPVGKVTKKYTVPDPKRPDALNFKYIKPCKFYDLTARGCKIYDARPWSCRIFPFLGIYGSEDRVKVNESCPASVRTMEILTAALQKVRADPALYAAGPEEVRRSKERLRSILADI